MTQLIIALLFYLSMLFNPNPTLNSNTFEDTKSNEVEQFEQKTDKDWGKKTK